MPEKKNSKGVSSYIKTQFESIETGKALSVAALVQELLHVFTFIKDRTSASARINLVLIQKKICNRFTKIRGKDKHVYVIRKTENIYLSQEVRKENNDGRTEITETKTSSELGSGQKCVVG